MEEEKKMEEEWKENGKKMEENEHTSTKYVSMHVRD